MGKDQQSTNDQKADAKNYNKFAGTIERLTESFMKNAPLQARLMMVFFAISILLIPLAIGAVLFINPIYGICVLLISLVPMGITFYIIRIVLPIIAHPPTVIHEGEYIDTTRYRSFSQFSTYLDAVRKKSHEIIQTETNQTVPLDNIRANVFLPDCAPVNSVFFKLSMPAGLRCNMKNPSEWKIRFMPGQGSVGTCFNEGQTRVTLDKHFINVEDIKPLIDPNLKWILSIPIMKEGTKEKYPIGVLNIDCLKNGIEKRTLDMITSKLDPTIKDKIIQIADISTIQQELNKIPKKWKLILQAKRA